MKEFDLELARKGAELCTRDGHKARIVCYDTKGEYPIAALVEENGQERSYLYTQEGGFHAKGYTHTKDLMLVTKKHEGWVIVYYDAITSSTRTCGYIYDTKEQALEEWKEIDGFITVTKIEWED